MFGWLKRRVEIAVASSYDQDIDRFIRGLKGAGDSEVGAMVACAAHWRNILEAQFGWDLDHSDLVDLADHGNHLLPTTGWRAFQIASPIAARTVFRTSKLPSHLIS
jgi:hypothetical protein